jgi:hypothetical protein
MRASLESWVSTKRDHENRIGARAVRQFSPAALPVAPGDPDRACRAAVEAQALAPIELKPEPEPCIYDYSKTLTR